MIIVVRNRIIEFKSWTRLFTFYFALILLRKGMNPSILPSQLWINDEADSGNQFRKRKTMKSNQLYSTRKMTLYLILGKIHNGPTVKLSEATKKK